MHTAAGLEWSVKGHEAPGGCAYYYYSRWGSRASHRPLGGTKVKSAYLDAKSVSTFPLSGFDTWGTDGNYLRYSTLYLAGLIWPPKRLTALWDLRLRGVLLLKETYLMCFRKMICRPFVADHSWQKMLRTISVML